MKKIFFLMLMMFLCSNAYAYKFVIPVDEKGNELGTASNPMTVSAAGGSGFCLSDGTNCPANIGVGTVNPGTTNFVSKYVNQNTIDDSALIFDNGTNVGIGTITTSQLLTVKGTSYFNGNVGIGDSAPAQKLDIDDGTVVIPAATINRGVNVTGSYSSASNNASGGIRTIYSEPHHTGTSSLGTLAGFYTYNYNDATAGTVTHHLGVVGRSDNTSTGNTTTTAGVYADAKNSGTGTLAAAASFYGDPVINSSTGTITKAYGLIVSKPQNTGGGTMTNAYGVVIPRFDTSTVASNNNVGLVIGGEPSGPKTLGLYLNGPAEFINNSFILSNSAVQSSSGTDTMIAGTWTRDNTNTGTTGTIRGEYQDVAASDASGTVAKVTGIESRAATTNANTVTDLAGFRTTMRASNASSVITAGYGYKVEALVNSGTYTNTYGVHVGDITTGTQTNTPYSFYASDANAIGLYSAGNVGIGTLSPASILAVNAGASVGQVTIDGGTGGCIMLRDTDDAGWTECDALDGTLSCSTDADGICD